MHILLIEDDSKVAHYVCASLREAGYDVNHSADGREGLEVARSGDNDLLIVDRMLPGMDGLEIVRELRQADILVPVLFLSALSDVDDRVSGLRAGGDDYLPKPFSVDELLARVDALLRRQSAVADVPTTQLEVGQLTMNLLTQEVTRDGQKIVLQPRE